MMSKIIKIILILSIISIVHILISCGSTNQASKESNKTQTNLIADSSKLEQEARYFFINGINYQVQNKDAEAIIEFQEALRFDKHPSIYYSMAKSYYNLFKKERALENLRLSLEIDPNHLPSLDLISDIYYFGDIKTAIEYNQRALDIEKTKKRLYKHAILNESIDINKSISIYLDILSEDETNITILNRIIDLYIEKDENENALTYLLKLEKLEPGNTQVLDQILRIYLNKNNYEDAFKYLKSKQVSISEIDYDNILYDFGLYLYNRKMEEDSIDIIQYLNFIQSDYKFNYNLNLMASFMATRYEKIKAEIFVNNMLKTTDSLSTTLKLAFNIYNSINDTINALNLIEKYSDIINSDSEMLLLVSYIYSMTEKDSLSLEYLKKGLILDSTNADIYSQMGFVYDKLGMVGMSDSSYSIALRIDPNHLNANNNFAYSLSVRDLRLEDALKMSQKVIDSEVQSSAYFDTYAWINYKLSNYEIALSYLLKAIELEDASAEVYEHLGLVYLELNKIDESIAAFQNALELDSNRILSREKLKMLKNK